MIELRNLTKTFPGPNGGVQALKDVSLTIDDGDIYGIIGMSGAGKSTLVRCINLLERPTQGTVLLDGQDLSTLSQKDLRQTRRKIAMIFQGFHLLQQRTCLKNVCFPLELAGVSRVAARQRAGELLELVGLPDKAGAYPSQLSGGQQQRVAIARALATDPKVLLCDEATSALDPNTTHAILSLIRQINRQTGITVVVITHQMSVVEEICNRVAILDNGVVAETGEVSRLFSRPSSPAARRLVFPQGADEVLAPCPGEDRLRVVFHGARTTRTPLIAKMAMELNLPANILSASTRPIGEKVYGSLLLGVPQGRAREAIAYLQNVPDVLAEEVTGHAE